MADYLTFRFATTSIGAKHMPDAPFAATPLETLIVDDEPGVCDLLAEFFRSHGCRVATVGRASEAIADLERDPARFTLVVTDLQLPDGDGFAVLRAAKQANPSMYVVLITGYASLDSAVKAVRLGAYDYLTKPFSLGQLEVVLDRIRDRLALESENRRLLKQLGHRAGPDPRSDVLGRLDTIDQRLARIETVLHRS